MTEEGPKKVEVFEASDKSLHRTVEQLDFYEHRLKIERYYEELRVPMKGLYANPLPSSSKIVVQNLPEILKIAAKFKELPKGFHAAVDLHARLDSILNEHGNKPKHLYLLQALREWLTELKKEVRETARVEERLAEDEAEAEEDEEEEGLWDEGFIAVDEEDIPA